MRSELSNSRWDRLFLCGLKRPGRQGAGTSLLINLLADDQADEQVDLQDGRTDGRKHTWVCVWVGSAELSG